MKRNFKYIAAYASPVLKRENRICSPAAINVINYVCSVLSRENRVEIISPRWTENKRGSYKKRKLTISKNIILTVCPSFGAKSKMGIRFKMLFTWIWLFFYLFFNTKKEETILAYHSLTYDYPLYFAKKIKKFELVLQVEEIYQDVNHVSRFFQKLEYKIIDVADKYLFPTELLNQKVNVTKKPATIFHGTYSVETNRSCKFNDGKIHCVYAGTFDHRKGGVTAAAAAEFLDERYHIHIIGFGSKEEKDDLLDIIKSVSQKTKCIITFDGLKSGEDYIEFIQSCDIGLSTQNPNAAFNATSFPSKVLSYLTNGLRVVSIRIKVLETSAVNDLLYYYDDNDPKSIADAIISVDMNDDYDSRNYIEKLDQEFSKDLYAMLKDINDK